VKGGSVSHFALAWHTCCRRINDVAGSEDVGRQSSSVTGRLLDARASTVLQHLTSLSSATQAALMTTAHPCSAARS
jgi:hypothetical protein